MKMYIAVLDEFPDYMVPTLVAHAVLSHHMTQEELAWDNETNDYSQLYNVWLHASFKKCVVRVNQKEFDKIALLDNVSLSHENKTLDAKKACAVLVIGNEVPNVLKYAKLWKPKV